MFRIDARTIILVNAHTWNYWVVEGKEAIEYIAKALYIFRVLFRMEITTFLSKKTLLLDIWGIPGGRKSGYSETGLWKRQRKHIRNLDGQK